MIVTDACFVYPAKPMSLPPSSSLFRELDNDVRYLAEVKKNGWRCLVRVIRNEIILWTRHKTTINDPLPGLRKALRELNLPNDTILDGELLEHRSKVKDTLMVWGILRFDGTWLDKISYKLVSEQVASLIPNSAHIVKPKSTLLNKCNFYEQILREDVDNEGIVLKKLDAPVPFFWNNSKEISTWLKVKAHA